jgi:hypothetical protein
VIAADKYTLVGTKTDYRLPQMLDTRTFSLAIHCIQPHSSKQKELIRSDEHHRIGQVFKHTAFIKPMWASKDLSERHHYQHMLLIQTNELSSTFYFCSYKLITVADIRKSYLQIISIYGDTSVNSHQDSSHNKIWLTKYLTK